MALWRRTHSYSTMNLNFPGEIKRDFRGAMVFTAFRCFQTMLFFPTCQVRVVRFYVSWLPPSAFRLPSASSCSSSSSAGPQPRVSTPSVPCRTSTARLHAKRSLPDLNREYARPVFPAGPQPRVCTPSVPCRTSTARIHAKCSLPDLNRDHPRQVFPAGPQPRPFAKC